VVLSAKPVYRQEICNQATRFGVPLQVIGSVQGDRLVVHLENEASTNTVVDVSIDALHDRWNGSLERALTQT
jgi:phosphoribosylformylglycinamidine (FGAM) synthase-like enzyme